MKELIVFRWIAILSLFVGLVPLLGWGFLDKRHLPYMIAVLTLLMVFNFFAKTSVSKSEKIKSPIQSSLFFHLLIDVFAAAGVLFVSGSAENPFIAILAIHGFLGGMLLATRPSILFLTCVATILGLLQIETVITGKKTLGFALSSVAMDFLSQWVLLIASWGVSMYFSKALQRQNNLIQNLREKQHVADKSKALGALAAGLSHELASPLNTLDLRMKRLGKDLESGALSQVSTEEKDKVFKEFKEAQGSLNSCVDIFFQMKQVFSGKVDLEFHSIEIVPFMSKLLRHWQLSHPNIQLQYLFEDEALKIQSQALALSEAVLDILDNSAEAMNFEGEVVLRIFRENGFVSIQICDNGYGLSEEILSRLGQPFVTSKVSGNGLGVYSTILFAESHGGSFTLENNSSRKGVKATLVLPEETNNEPA